MSRLPPLLYRLARASAWARAIGKLGGGNALPIVRRARNRYIMRVVGRILRR